MHAHVTVQKIKKLRVETGTGPAIRVTLQWGPTGTGCTVLVAGQVAGYLRDRGAADHSHDEPQYHAINYSPIPESLDRVYLWTEDFLEGIAFVVTGPGGWYSDPHRGSYYRSDAETHLDDVLNVLGA